MMIGQPTSPNLTFHIPPLTLDPTDEVYFHGDFDTTDEFRMYEFKIRRCPRVRTHDWTECPYAHPGEKARRRDPRKFHYSATPCPDFRKGCCKRGETCEYSHGVFECWLHPARYRTQPCRDGTNCLRPICFFAHTPEQFRVVTHQSPPRIAPFHQHSSYFSLSSPTSTLMSPSFSTPSDSPPVSPNCGLNELMFSMRGLDLNNKVNMASSWNGVYEEEPVMERVESGRNLRAKVFEKLRKENSLNRDDSDLVM